MNKVNVDSNIILGYSRLQDFLTAHLIPTNNFNSQFKASESPGSAEIVPFSLAVAHGQSGTAKVSKEFYIVIADIHINHLCIFEINSKRLVSVGNFYKV